MFGPQLFWGHRKLTNLSQTFYLHTPSGMSPLLFLSCRMWGLSGLSRSLGSPSMRQGPGAFLGCHVRVDLSRGEGQSPCRGSEISQPCLFFSLPSWGKPYPALSPEKNWFRGITFYSKSFVYAPSPRLLKLKTLFSQTMALILFCVRTSLRKRKQNCCLPEWQKVWPLCIGNTGEHQLMFQTITHA